MPTTPLPTNWPPPVREALTNLARVLDPHPRLAGAFVFGDLVRGDHASARSPIGLALVLEAVGDPADAALAEVLHAAFATVRVEPWVVLEAELPRIADVFPVKLFEIERYGRHLCGRLTEIRAHSTPEQLRLRTEQLARNMLMRRRTIALLQGGTTPQRGHVEAANRLRVLLAALDHLRGGREDGLVERSATLLGLAPERLSAALSGTPGAIDEALVELVRCTDAHAEEDA